MNWKNGSKITTFVNKWTDPHLFYKSERKEDKWQLRSLQATSIVQIASIGKAQEISIPICIRPPYMTATADAAIQKITEVQQAAQCHNVQISKPILTQDNAQKGKIKKERGCPKTSGSKQ